MLSQEKNNLGRKDLALTYRIESAKVTTDDSPLIPVEVGRFVLGEPSERRVADVITARNAKDRIGERSSEVLEAVRQGPGAVDASMVAQRTGMSNDDAGQYLRRLERNLLLIRVRRGFYDWPGRLGDHAGGPRDGE